MAIRFRIPAYAVERVAHAYSPLLEAVLSLHVVVEPKHHPLQHPWVRRMQALPPALKRDLAAFSFAYRRTLPDFLAPSTDHELRPFEDELAALRALDADTVALEFTRPLYDTEGTRDTALLERTEVQRHIVATARLFGASPDLARLVFEDPLRLRDAFADLLERYWEAAFAEEWARIEPLLADTVSEAGRRIAADGLYAFLRGVSLQLRVDEEQEEFGIDVPHRHTVDVTERRRLLLVPSAYVWPHVHVKLRRAMAAQRRLCGTVRDGRGPPAAAVRRARRRAPGAR